MYKQKYRNPDFKFATEYGRLITIKGSIASVSKIRLYDNHQYNWNQTLRNGRNLYKPTDQTYDIESNFDCKLSFYDEVWFEGVCIYKKPWYLKLIQLFKVGRNE